MRGDAVIVELGFRASWTIGGQACWSLDSSERFYERMEP
jgi:hypothetical protein